MPLQGGARFAWTIVVVTILVAGLHLWLLLTHRWDPVLVSPARVQASYLVIALYALIIASLVYVFGERPIARDDSNPDPRSPPPRRP